MRETKIMNTILVAGSEFTVIKKIGEGGFSRVYEALGPDKKIRALKIINILGMKGEISKEEVKELNLLRSLSEVSEIAKLVCSDVQYSQEGILMIIVMEKGETSFSQILRNTKVLSIAKLLYYWESILGCIVALHER